MIKIKPVNGNIENGGSKDPDIDMKYIMLIM